MKKISERQVWEAGKEIRGIIHGWAFAGGSGLRSRLTRAEEALKAIPEPMRKRLYEEFVKPLREAAALPTKYDL